MDNQKTGQLISELRRQKGLTQQDLAEQLHITGKAVSKWERGLSFPSVDLLEPLAELLGISVVDLLAGEIVSPQDLVAQTSEVSLQALKREKRWKKKLLLVVMAAALLFLLYTPFAVHGSAIFQRGNPLPYLAAVRSLNEETPYVAVSGQPGVYISKAGECPELFAMIEETRDVSFAEQMGSCYFFTNGADTLYVDSEIYWRYFTVWVVPQNTLRAPG